MGFSRIHTCSACGVQNRVSVKHLASNGHCGACKAAFSPTADPLSVNEAEFREIVASAQVPVLVDFWAEWCGPCRMAAPEVQRTAANTAGRALVLKVNTEQSPRLASEYGVSAIPNFLVMMGGRVVRQQPGLVDHRQMESWLEQASRAVA